MHETGRRPNRLADHSGHHWLCNGRMAHMPRLELGRKHIHAATKGDAIDGQMVEERHGLLLKMTVEKLNDSNRSHGLNAIDAAMVLAR